MHGTGAAFCLEHTRAEIRSLDFKNGGCYRSAYRGGKGFAETFARNKEVAETMARNKEWDRWLNARILPPRRYARLSRQLQDQC
jgi:hypothetical protein